MFCRLTLLLQKITFALVLCLPVCAQVVTWECTEAELPERVSPADALTYLKGFRPNLSSACVIDAIRRTTHYKPAINTLVSYLDFKVPVQPGRPMVALAGATRGLYPAADALARMDKDALPAVKHALINNSLPTQSRVNAAKVLSALEWDDKPTAIRFIAHAANAASDISAEDALLKEAHRVIPFCSDAEKQKCQEALNEQ